MRDGCHPADGEVAAVIHPRSDVAYVAVGVRDEFNASNDPGGSILAIGPALGIVAITRLPRRPAR